MARLYHPDMHSEDAEGYTAKFQEITEAYETLSDDYKKEMYDLQYRQYVLNEAVFQEDHYQYYYEPQPQYTAYREYYRPVEKRRTPFASYASLILLAVYFIRMLMNVSSPGPENVRYDNNIRLSPQMQHLIDSLTHPKDTFSFKPGVSREKAVIKPF